MRAPLANLTRFARGFVRDEEGAITVEAVIWIPFFFFVLALISDASMAFYSKAQAYRILENGNRAFAIQPAATEVATESWIKQQFIDNFTNATAANVTVDATLETTADKKMGWVSTSLSYRARDVVLFNTLSVLGNWKITVRARQFVERPLS